MFDIAGDPVGFFSAPLNKIAVNGEDNLYQDDYLNNLTWIDLCSTESMVGVICCVFPFFKFSFTEAFVGSFISEINFLCLQNTSQVDKCKKPCGRIRCAVLLSPKSEVEDRDETDTGRKSGFIQISPSMVGPWTTVRLNYAAPAACWRLGNDVVASEVVVKDGNRYVNIRSLVSVLNNTDFILDLCLVSKASGEQIRHLQLNDSAKPGDSQIVDDRIEIDEFFETETFNPTIGWVGCQPIQDRSEGGSSHQVGHYRSYCSFLKTVKIGCFYFSLNEFFNVGDSLSFCFLNLFFMLWFLLLGWGRTWGWAKDHRSCLLSSNKV